MDADVLVVGAGPAGLAVAACVRRKGLETLVLDRGAARRDSWRYRYDRLHLHTPRVQSALPGLRMPASLGRWVARTTWPTTSGATPSTTGSSRVSARRCSASSAAGALGGTTPRRRRVGAPGRLRDGIRRLPASIRTGRGSESFARRRSCTPSDYRRAAPYAGQDVLVVGAGNTGAEIAADLAENGARRVWLSVRTPPNIVPRQLGPAADHAPVDPDGVLPRVARRPCQPPPAALVLGDLTRYGLPAPREGVVAQARATGLTPDDRRRPGRGAARGHRHAGRRGRAIRRRRRRCSPTGGGSHRTRSSPPRATRRDSPRGRPPGRARRARTPDRVRAAPSSSAPGLRFVGLTNPLKGQLFQIGLDARAIARVIARERRMNPVGRSRAHAR